MKRFTRWTLYLIIAVLLLVGIMKADTYLSYWRMDTEWTSTPVLPSAQEVVEYMLQFQHPAVP